MNKFIFAILLLLCFTSTWASDPGEPFGAEDWVIVLPDLYAEPFLPYLPESDCPDPADVPDLRCGSSPQGDIMDAAGNIYTFEYISLGPQECSEHLQRTNITRLLRDGTVELVAYIEDRCHASLVRYDDAAFHLVLVDLANGDIIVKMKITCRDDDGTSCNPGPYDPGFQVSRIDSGDLKSRIVRSRVTRRPVIVPAGNLHLHDDVSISQVNKNQVEGSVVVADQRRVTAIFDVGHEFHRSVPQQPRDVCPLEVFAAFLRAERNVLERVDVSRSVHYVALRRTSASKIRHISWIGAVAFRQVGKEWLRV